jgi:hypothetical protein
MAGRLFPITFVVTLYFLAPIAIAMLVLGASCRAVLVAYTIWFGVMAVMVMPGSKRWREKAGWVVGLGMFLTTPVVLVIVLLLREIGGLR